MIAYPQSYLLAPVWMDGDEGGDFSCAGRALAQQRWGKAAANAADKKAAHAKRVETRKKNASDAKARNSSALEELPVLRSGGGGCGGGLRPRERAHCGDAAAHGRRKDYESEATDEGEVIAHDTWAV